MLHKAARDRTMHIVHLEEADLGPRRAPYARLHSVPCSSFSPEVEKPGQHTRILHEARQRCLRSLCMTAIGLG